MTKATYFENKVVWITGASSGLGGALARACSAAGARLILSARSREKLLDLANEQKVENPHVSILPLDLLDQESHSSVAKKAEETYGQIDVLVHNAGVSQRSLIKDLEYDVVHDLVDVNFLGAVSLTLNTLKDMYARKSGHIVLISSLAGKFGIPLRSGYCAAKHAIHGFYETLSAEAWRENINVTIVVPGWIKTDMTIKAKTGDGSSHGVVDPGFAKAKDPAVFAPGILRAISKKKFEYYTAFNPKLALGLFLHRFFPNLLRKRMRKAKVT